jgi:hypothetical protein
MIGIPIILVYAIMFVNTFDEKKTKKSAQQIRCTD